MVQFGWIFKTGLKETDRNTDRQTKVEGKRNEKTEQQE